MLSVIWSGASNASDVLFLIAAIVAGISAIVIALSTPPAPWGALVPAALCLIALGLLAV